MIVIDDKFISQLKRHEGFSKYPYKDTVQKLTIGYGRNLDDVGISEEESEFMLTHDVEISKNEVQKILSALKIPEPHLHRKHVLYNMMFNLGYNRFLNFVKMLKAIKEQDYEQAAKEMLDSRWARQVGKRATELAEQMRTTNIED